MTGANPTNLFFPKKAEYLLSTYYKESFGNLLAAQLEITNPTLSGITKETFDQLGIDFSDQKAVERAESFYKNLKGKITVNPTDTPGVFFVYNQNQEPVAVFKAGERRAVEDRWAFEVAKDLGFSNQYVPTYFGCLFNPFAPEWSEEEEIESFRWDGQYKYTDISKLRSPEEKGFLIGGLSPFVGGEWGFHSQEQLVFSIVSAMLLGLSDVQSAKDGKNGNIIDGVNIDVEGALPERSSKKPVHEEDNISSTGSLTRTSSAAEPQTPFEDDFLFSVDSGLEELNLRPVFFFPCLSDSPFTHEPLSLEIKDQLIEKARNWNLRDLCQKLSTAEIPDFEPEKQSYTDLDSEESSDESSNVSRDATPRRRSSLSDLYKEEESSSDASASATPRRKRSSSSVSSTTSNQSNSSDIQFEEDFDNLSFSQAEEENRKDLGGLDYKIEEAEEDPNFPPRDVSKDSKVLTQEQLNYFKERAQTLGKIILDPKFLENKITLLELVFAADPLYAQEFERWEFIEILKNIDHHLSQVSGVKNPNRRVSLQSLQERFYSFYKESTEKEFNSFANRFLFDLLPLELKSLSKTPPYEESLAVFLDFLKINYPKLYLPKFLCRIDPLTLAGGSVAPDKDRASTAATPLASAQGGFFS